MSWRLKEEKLEDQVPYGTYRSLCLRHRVPIRHSFSHHKGLLKMTTNFHTEARTQLHLQARLKTMRHKATSKAAHGHD